MWRPTASRSGIGELAGSLSMLAITIALLAGASTMALLSVHQAAALISDSGRRQQAEAGLLVGVVDVRSNSSGTYVLLYDYGWVSAAVESVYVGAQQVTWTSTCGGDWTGRVCTVVLQSPPGGDATIVVGGATVETRI